MTPRNILLTGTIVAGPLLSLLIPGGAPRAETASVQLAQAEPGGPERPRGGPPGAGGPQREAPAAREAPQQREAPRPQERAAPPAARPEPPRAEPPRERPAPPAAQERREPPQAAPERREPPRAEPPRERPAPPPAPERREPPPAAREAPSRAEPPRAAPPAPAERREERGPRPDARPDAPPPRPDAAPGQRPAAPPVPPSATQPRPEPGAPRPDATPGQRPVAPPVPPSAAQPRPEPGDARPDAGPRERPAAPAVPPSASQPRPDLGAPRPDATPQQRTVAPPPPGAAPNTLAPTAPGAPAPVGRQAPQGGPGLAPPGPNLGPALAPPDQTRGDLRQGDRDRGDRGSDRFQGGDRPRVEERDGRTYIRENDNRLIIREGGRDIIRHDELERLRRGARDVDVQQRANGRREIIIVRPDGDRIVNLVDDQGVLVRRERRARDGRTYVLIDNDFDRPRGSDGFYRQVELPPLRLNIPRERYIVESEDAPFNVIEETLMAPPVERVERPYSLDEVRYNQRLREKMSRVDVDTINFATNSADVDPNGAARLDSIARALNDAIRRNPNEVFLVEGHTDAVGGDTENLALSDRRAESVAAILTDRYQIPAENLVTQGYGEQFLKVQTQAAERQNRRVTVRRITPLLQQGQNQAPAPR